MFFTRACSQSTKTSTLTTGVVVSESPHEITTPTRFVVFHEMVLCEIAEQSQLSFVYIWLILTLLGLVSTFTFSGILFVKYYANPTYEVRARSPAQTGPNRLSRADANVRHVKCTEMAVEVEP